MKTWACKADASACDGPPHPRNVKVVYTGYAELDHALDAAVKKGNVCTDEDMNWCNSQTQFLLNTSQAKTQEEAQGIVTAPGAWTEAACKRCFAPAAAERLPVGSRAVGGSACLLGEILRRWRASASSAAS